jgi:uncharacterized membrane protein (UPF0182 family)
VPVFGSPRRALFVILGIGVIIIGAIMGSTASAFWKEYLMFNSAVPFDGYPADPIFGRDLGFYVFTLPFYRFLYGWIMGSLAVITLFSIFFHLINGGILLRRGIEFSLFARTHISSLLGLLVMTHGLGYRLSAYKLLFNESGRFFGAGYTAVHANLLAYNVAMVISFIAAGLLFANIIIKSFKMPIIVLIVLIPAYFLIGTILPSLQQRFIVVPNELEKERPYITQNIKYTRLAYDLERVKETEFANRRDLSYKDIKKNSNTMENISAWDWRPLKQTYKQLQELKPYYYFNDIDVDRSS